LEHACFFWTNGCDPGVLCARDWQLFYESDSTAISGAFKHETYVGGIWHPSKFLLICRNIYDIIYRHLSLFRYRNNPISEQSTIISQIFLWCPGNQSSGTDIVVFFLNMTSDILIICVPVRVQCPCLSLCSHSFHVMNMNMNKDKDTAF
jgi:hypothetical protein